MAQREARAGGAKLSKSEVLTIRLDPKMRYLAELASRIHRRTLSSYIDWVIHESFSNVEVPGTDYSLADVAESLWDLDEADRFVLLARSYPALLTHEEQRRWKLIRENEAVWDGQWILVDGKPEWDFHPDAASGPLLAPLREHWQQFVRVARGEAGIESLPKLAPPQNVERHWIDASDEPDSDFPGSLED